MTIETRNAQSAKEAVEILNSLNFRQVNFEFHGENYSNDYKIAYRHFGGVTADGEGTCFGLIEIVINGKLDTVRFINSYRETAVDIKIGNANYTVDDKGEVELIDAEPEQATETAEANIEDYAISTDAQEIATNAEQDNAFNAKPAIERYKLSRGTLGHTIDRRGRHMWHNCYSGIISKAEVAERLNYFGLTMDEYLACEEIYTAEVRRSIYDEIHAYRVEELAADYAVSVEAQEVATDAENEQATKAANTPEVSEDEVFNLLPELDELNDVEGFDSEGCDDCDRDDRFNRGERHAEKLTAKLREFDSTVEVTYGIDEYDEDVYYLQYDGIYRTPFTLDGVEGSFHAMKSHEQATAVPDDIAEMQARFDKAVAESKVDDFATLAVNGEYVSFVEGKLAEIDAPALDAKIVFNNGKKTFYYRDTVYSKAKFFNRIDELGDIRAQIAAVETFKRTHGACTIMKQCFFRAPFVAMIHAVIKSGEQSREKHFAGDFTIFAGAKKFIDDFKAFASEIKFTAVIKRDKTTGEECYRREFDGEETLSVDAPEPQDAEPEEYAVTAEAQDAAIEAEVEFAKLGEPETKETLRKKAAKLVDLKEGLDKEKAFAECARDKFEIAQTWMRAASKNSYSAEFYAEQIATMGAAVKKLNERIAELAAQITAVETELETVNKKITAPKKAA